MTPVATAVENSTNANSPLCNRELDKAPAPSLLSPDTRPSTHSTAALIAISNTTSSTIRSGCVIRRSRSAHLPTAMKNKPSTKPLTGSISSSSPYRNQDSYRSTPALTTPNDTDPPNQHNHNS